MMFIKIISFICKAALSLILILFSSSAVLALDDDMKIEDFNDLFTSAVIASKQWVYSLDIYKNKIIGNKIDKLDYLIAQELKKNISNYSDDNVVKKWSEIIYIHQSKDNIVNMQINNFIDQIDNVKNLNIKMSEDVDANLVINIYGGDPKVYGSSFHIGYPNYDVLFNGWKYRFNWPEKIYVFEKIALYDTTLEDIKNLFNSDFVYYRDATPFSFQSSNHIEGYIKTDRANEIQKAECYIYAGHSEIIKKILTNQCLIRSLGFPGFVGKKYDSLLSKEINDTLFVNGEIRKIDFALIHALYSEDIRQGMNLEELEKALSNVIHE